MLKDNRFFLIFSKHNIERKGQEYELNEESGVTCLPKFENSFFNRFLATKHHM